jgi:hypothetical protein
MLRQLIYSNNGVVVKPDNGNGGQDEKETGCIGYT